MCTWQPTDPTGGAADAEDEFASFYQGSFARLVGQVALVTGGRHGAEDVVKRGPRAPQAEA